MDTSPGTERHRFLPVKFKLHGVADSGGIQHPLLCGNICQVTNPDLSICAVGVKIWRNWMRPVALNPCVALLAFKFLRKTCQMVTTTMMPFTIWSRQPIASADMCHLILLFRLIIHNTNSPDTKHQWGKLLSPINRLTRISDLAK